MSAWLLGDKATNKRERTDRAANIGFGLGFFFTISCARRGNLEIDTRYSIGIFCGRTVLYSMRNLCRVPES